jgi:two-component system, NtrC family, response regulator AtoC
MSPKKHGATVLVVDDERLIRWSISQRLGDDGYRVLEAADARSARELAPEADLLILDHGLPDATGFDLMQQLREDGLLPPVLMLTGRASVEHAVEAMKFGAWHYAAKPVDLEQLMMLVERGVETSLLRQQVRALQERAGDANSFDRIVGDSDSMNAAKRLLRKIAGSPATTILLTGESGTGKDLVAKALHHGSSRSARPFMNITCSALQDTLLESELFGHERGAFTDAKRTKKGLLELAEGGTVFLDEIGETSAAMQAKLLRFLEEKTFKRVGGERDISVDVRVIAATHRDLAELVSVGRFRDDLYWRLRVLPVELPPLRDRGGDIPLLARAFLADFASRFGRSSLSISSTAMEQLAAYRWPGNVRELKNTVERAVLLADGDDLQPRDFLLPASRQVTADGYLLLPAGGIELERVERGFVQQALQRSGGNRTRAARLLGITRDQVRYRVDKFGLT